MIARSLLSVFVAGFALFLTAALALAGDAGKRVALVIGNAEYSAVPRLLNPQNDARDIAATLRRIGFDVTEGANLDFRGMRLAIRDFAEAAQEADVVLVYYAGHGIEIDNTNYLIPVNAELKRDRDVEFEAIRLDAVLNAIEGSDALKIVLVDACRNNPFTVQMTRKGATRSIGRGLARIEPSGVLVGYAAKGGTYAMDGEGRNSPYATALLQHLEEPGLELGKLFRKVRDTVFELTEGRQEPFIYGSLPGRDIFLVEPVAEPKKVAAVAPVAARHSELLRRYALAERSGDANAWEKFIDDFADYPDHELVILAHQNRDLLESLFLKRKREFAQTPWIDVEFEDDGITPKLTRQQRVLVQKSLNFMGFDPGSADGVFGPKTNSAIALARSEADLWPGSKVDRPFLEILVNPLELEQLISKRAKSYKDIVLPSTTEPRLAQALKTLQHREVLFDYYKGNLYIGVLPRVSRTPWQQASRISKNAGGHLVTISDRAENDFVSGLISNDERFFFRTKWDVYGPYIGLYQLNKANEPRGGWVWVDGKPLNYDNFAPGQPDNFEDRHHYGSFLSKDTRRRTVSTWGDIEGANLPISFIIEIE